MGEIAKFEKNLKLRMESRRKAQKDKEAAKKQDKIETLSLRSSKVSLSSINSKRLEQKSSKNEIKNRNKND